jgi:SPP1 family predicted phage head-tail adaptor
MKIGKLRHRIHVQEDLGTTYDADGNVIHNWTTIATVWADVMPLSGREALLAKQINATTTHNIRVRSMPELRQDMRIRFGDRYFDINAIIDDREVQRHQLLTCTESFADRPPAELTEEEENNLRSLAMIVPISYYDMRHIAGTYRAEPN